VTAPGSLGNSASRPRAPNLEGPFALQTWSALRLKHTSLLMWGSACSPSMLRGSSGGTRVERCSDQPHLCGTRVNCWRDFPRMDHRFWRPEPPSRHGSVRADRPLTLKPSRLHLANRPRTHEPSQVGPADRRRTLKPSRIGLGGSIPDPRTVTVRPRRRRQSPDPPWLGLAEATLSPRATVARALGVDPDPSSHGGSGSPRRL
jgi:hypothetical protein